jgi:hypothetical protein
MAGGIVWFSLASLTLPLALAGPVQAAGLTIPAVLLARTCVVRGAAGAGRRARRSPHPSAPQARAPAPALPRTAGFARAPL